MSNVVNNQEYYDFFNLNSYIEKSKIKGLDMSSIRYLKDYVNTFISMFKYKNLPNKKMKSRIVETALCFNNHLCWYENTVYNDGIICRYVPEGQFDEYWQPLTVTLITLSGKTIGTNIKFEDIVVMRDNSMDIIPFIVLNAYINEIKNIENTLHKNIKQAKMPSFFTGDKNMVATFNKIIEKCEKDDVFAITSKEVAQAFNQYDIHFPIESQALIEIMKNYMNWTDNSMGIYASSTQKKERLLAGEVESQNDKVDTIYQDRLSNRRTWIDDVNEKFHHNIELVESYKQYTQDHIKLSEQYNIAMNKDLGKVEGDSNDTV